MTNASALFRSLIVYSICLPVAAIVGYLLATTVTDLYSLYSIAAIFALMSIPMFLRWHYPWMLLTWNMAAIIFFLPGRPFVGLLLVGISFSISVLQYILNRRLNFISVPSVARPLLFILAVVLLTARLTGGIGLNALGGAGDNIGGKGYVVIIASVMGYYALTALKIPPEKRKLYFFLFYAGTFTQAIANLALVISPGLSFIFLIFPTDLAGIHALNDHSSGAQDAGGGIVRLGGLSSSALAVLSLLLALYGIRGILDMRKSWRMFVALLSFVCILAGGYRSYVIIAGLTMAVLFYLEGLARTRLMPSIILCSILGAAIMLPVADKLPLNIQRSLTFIPGIPLDERAVANAQASTDWRINMWENVLPDVPKYLILGKGLNVNIHDMEQVRLTRGGEEGGGSALSGDYHNGPLSLIIPFGLFGVAGFLWFLTASTRVLYRNYKYGDPSLLTFNRFLLATFIMKMVVFFVVFGSFYADLLAFVGVIGLSIALNHGVAKPAPEPIEHPVFHRFKLRLANANANANAAR